MYKVFFNESAIIFDSQVKISSNNHPSGIVKYVSYDSVNQIIDEIETQGARSRFMFVEDEQMLLWKDFKSRFKSIPAAGGLVRNDKGSYLFIRRFGMWDLPKGKIEKKEMAEDAAVREVEEECGISGLNVIRQLDSTFHIYRSPWLTTPDNLVLKETKWFLMEYSGNEIPQPQVQEMIEEVRWFSPDDMDQVLSNTYTSLIEFLQKSLSSI
jgi:8-oxo-dGTP pyrophosphatase MutT (NUDIX family)